jgi:hypothetical protein
MRESVSVYRLQYNVTHDTIQYEYQRYECVSDLPTHVSLIFTSAAGSQCTYMIVTLYSRDQRARRAVVPARDEEA